MALSNYERVGKALDFFKIGLANFVEREMKTVHGEDTWQKAAKQNIRNERDWVVKKGVVQWDAHLLLSVMWHHWNNVFSKTLGPAERSLAGELRDIRNRWAHQQAFSTDDAYRALDSMGRFLRAVSADEANDVEDMKQDLLRIRYEEQARTQRRKESSVPIEGQPKSGLKPWREIVTPHPDVASGRYVQAEFAADLDQVHQGRGSSEYREPREFFERTFLTDGLRDLLKGAILRLTAKGADPIVKLQTNFGGGKTHSLLALYHLFSGTAANELLGIDGILDEMAVESLPEIQRAVLVGTAISAAKAHKKPDGTVVNAFWGEMAWQLGQKDGYAMVADADNSGISPGSNDLKAIFERFGPCLILIDEWLAHVRMLYHQHDLPAGSFDAHFTFVQALTEAVKNTSNTLLVASIPASDIEKGGEGGKEALVRLEHVFRRIAAPWRPANQEESFEIVRRRLFVPIDTKDFTARDNVVKAFIRQYRDQSSEFPQSVGEGEYERRMQSAYPIHPELFERLYEDWGSLDKFQRTRGVLRLMAAIIHELWERNDPSLLIMPANVPIDASPVMRELTHYLEDSWVPVIETDVDGANSTPLKLDRENPNLGRYSACRRVARTIYLGSAPTYKAAHSGIDERKIKLGCIQPGESVATFGDALRRLTDQSTHLYVDAKRFWFSTQPSVTRMAQDRAAQQDIHDVWDELRKRLRSDRARGDFVAMHAVPADSGDVPDEMEARLVIIDPEKPHTRNTMDSPACKEADYILNNRGNSPRLYRNTLVSLAPDKGRLDDLEQAIRQYLAWSSIVSDKVRLNLDVYQSNQSDTKRKEANDVVDSRIKETYVWLLIPAQPNPDGPLEWQEVRVQGTDALAVRASRKLKNDEHLISQFSATRLRMALDQYLWKDANHISVKKLWEYLASYLYLPRLRDNNVMLEAIQDGIGDLTWVDNFAYAEAWDESKKRYLSLKAGQVTSIVMDGSSVLVKPEVAGQQLQEDADASQEQTGKPQPYDQVPAGGESARDIPGEETKPSKPKRFHATKTLDTLRITRDIGQIADEVIQHFSSSKNSQVRISIDIQAVIPDGADEQLVRTVTENCRTLKFDSHGFEDE